MQRRQGLVASAVSMLVVCCVTGQWTVKHVLADPHPSYPTHLTLARPEGEVRRCAEAASKYQTDYASPVYHGDGRRLQHDVKLDFVVRPVTESRTDVSTRVLESKVLTHSGGQQACLGHPVPAGSVGYTHVPPTTAHEYRALCEIARCLGVDMTGLPTEPAAGQPRIDTARTLDERESTAH